MGKLDTASFLTGDVFDKLEEIPDESVHTVITSPPYWGLRNYGSDGQLGLEETPDEFVENLVNAFQELRRVLRDDGTFWLNIGDSYYNYRPGAGQKLSKQTISNSDQDLPDECPRRARKIEGLKEKDLVGIPWRTALAMQRDGWWLRQDIIWAKGVSFCDSYNGACRPESVKDRFTNAHEHMFMFSNDTRYYFNSEGVKERTSTGTRNPRDVWTINPSSYSDAHFATFPVKLVDPCVKAGTSDYGVCAGCGSQYYKDGNSNWKTDCSCDTDEIEPATVLDPFMGSGTTGISALKHERQFIGIDIKEDYVNMAKNRIKEHGDVPVNHDFW